MLRKIWKPKFKTGVMRDWTCRGTEEYALSDIHDEPGHLTGSAFPAGVKAVGSGDAEEDLEA